MSAPLDLDGPHWRFALALYEKPGVSEACLAVQDELGVDVNVMLIALYASASRRLAIGPQEAAALDRAVAAWRDSAIKPIRSLRRTLKAGVNGVPRETVARLRSSVQMLELEAERISHAVLAEAMEAFGTATDRPRRAAAAAAADAIVAFYAQDAVGGTEIAGTSALAALIDAV